MLLGYQVVRHRRGLIQFTQHVKNWAIRRARLSAGLAFGLACLAGPSAIAVDIPTLETIGLAYQGRDQGIRSIRADYHAEQALLVNPQAYFQSTHTYELMPSDLTLVVAADGRRYQAVIRKEHQIDDLIKAIQKRKGLLTPLDPNNLFYPDIAAAMRTVKTRQIDDFRLYDGQNLWGYDSAKLSSKGVESRGYIVRDIPSQTSPYFTSTPLDRSSWTFRMSSLPKDDEQRLKHQIPDRFEVDEFTIFPNTERVGEDECVVLADSGKQKLWLLPDKKFALRKSESYRDGQKVFVAEFGDWRPFGKGGWIANKTTTTSFGVKKFHPVEFEGKPLYRVTYTLTKLLTDDPASEALLHVKVNPGDLILDQSLATGPGKGKDSVNYQVPADPKDLDRVIAEAVEKERLKHPRPWYYSPAPWIAAVAAVVIAVVVIRQVRKR